MFKKILKSIGDFLFKILTDINELVENKAPQAVKITQKLKLAIEEHGGKIEWILDQTKTEKDNEAYEFVKNKLPILIKELAVIDGLATNETPVDEAYKIYMGYIYFKTKEGRAKEWIFIAGHVLGFILGRKIPIDILIMATQRAYHLIFKK